MLTVLLSALILGSAVLLIRAEYQESRYSVYLFKPLTTLLILLIALQATKPVTPLYKYAIVAGLVFSLVGDIFLMLPDDRFIPGLMSFLVAHLCYIAAFSAGIGFRVSSGWTILFLVYGLIVFGILSSHLGKMKGPALAYMLAILIMAWQALERWLETRQRGALLALLGACLFVISDTALAFNRFRGRYNNAQVLILSTYYAAQWLIALSISSGELL